MNAHIIQGAASGAVEPGGICGAVLEVLGASVANIGMNLHDFSNAAILDQLFRKPDIIPQHMDWGSGILHAGRFRSLDLLGYLCHCQAYWLLRVKVFSRL